MKADENKSGALQIQNNSNKKLIGVKADSKLSLNRDLKVDGCQSNLYDMLKCYCFLLSFVGDTL